MLNGIDIHETQEFVSKKDSGETPTKFILRPLSNRQKIKLFDGAFEGKGEAVDVNKMFAKLPEILKAGVKEIHGIKVGNKVINLDNVDDSTIDIIPFEVLSELLEAVVKYNFVSGEEEKN
jgi:hypothetical protein